jgi:hypothetical protein
MLLYPFEEELNFPSILIEPCNFFRTKIKVVSQKYKGSVLIFVVEDAEKSDFRKGAFDNMISFLKNNGLAEKRPDGNRKYKQKESNSRSNSKGRNKLTLYPSF